MAWDIVGVGFLGNLSKICGPFILRPALLRCLNDITTFVPEKVRSGTPLFRIGTARSTVVSIGLKYNKPLGGALDVDQRVKPNKLRGPPEFVGLFFVPKTEAFGEVRVDPERRWLHIQRTGGLVRFGDRAILRVDRTCRMFSVQRSS